MGREIRRVPLDFNWPLRKAWPGFFLSVCQEVDENCDVCRHFGQLAGILEDPESCPRVKIDPPAGDGWQLWETISEGSPVSPVFATPEELADWLVQPGNDTSITRGTTRDQWLRFITGPGWAPSMCLTPDGMIPGVQME